MGDTEQFAERSFGANLLAAVGGPALRWAVVPLAGAVLAPLGLIATGTLNATTIAASMASPLSVLAARSPGERAPGALTQTKNRGPALDKDKLTELLTHPLPPPGAPGAVPGPLAGPLAESIPEGVPDEAMPVAEADVPYLPGPLASGVGPVVGPIFAADVPGVGGGGGGGTTPGGGTSVTPDTPVVSSVPEPSTWATLILGFGLVGGAMRSRRSRDAGKDVVRPIG